MKKRFIVLFAILTGFANTIVTNNCIATGKTTLTGKITDKKTGEPIPGVAIYIPDLKTGASSNADGNYKIENLPQTKILVQVSFIGFKIIAENIDLSTTTQKDFSLEESVAELNEVVVTGLSQAGEKNRTPTPITTISSIQLKQVSSTNIIDALATQPGISQVTTGSGISKPVIRGLGYNRVVVVNDGIRQEGQQWGDEHGIEIDEFSVNKVEILKGPASLSYGSDAMAGVINMLSGQTLPEGKIQGSILTNYQTNNGLFGASLNLAGNKKGFIWDIRYSNKMAHAYQNKYDGYVFNSGYRENNFGGIIGFNKSWGYSHLHFSVYNLTPGIVEGERDSATGSFIKPIALNDSTEDVAIATDKDFKSYTPLTPYQKIHHYKAVFNNSFIIRNGSLKAIIGWQQNQRQEYADILEENKYGLYFLLNTINYDVRYVLPEKNNFNISFGANGMYQTSQNKGTEFLIPEYNLFDVGVFGIVKKSFDKLDISGGLRYDSRNEHGKDLFLDANGEKTDTPDATSFHQFITFNTAFTGVSGSIGATYQFNDKVFTKLNVSRGFRAPNIAEISANGVHEGTINYIIGVPTLKAENSLQLDYALGLNSEHITAEADLFSNNISNFIFLSKLQSQLGGDSLTDGFSTFKYSSGQANLLGGEISIDIHPHPLDWLHFENSFSYVQSTQKNQPDSTKYLPFTPSPKFSSELKANAKKLSKSLNNAYIEIGLDNYFNQDKFYAAYGTETATAGYTLLNFGIGTDVVSKTRTLLSLYINVSNLTDVAYQSHLSRLKYGAENNVTGRTGVFNMGRNISFKLIVPIDFSKKKTE
ncbi:MAG: TonB-dependent receptor [Bacteroidia bacterium]